MKKLILIICLLILTSCTQPHPSPLLNEREGKENSLKIDNTGSIVGSGEVKEEKPEETNNQEKIDKLKKDLEILEIKTSTGTNGITISGDLQWVENSDLIKKITVLSCKENFSKDKDIKDYELKSWNGSSYSFNYVINEKNNNICPKIGYDIKYDLGGKDSIQTNFKVDNKTILDLINSIIYYNGKEIDDTYYLYGNYLFANSNTILKTELEYYNLDPIYVDIDTKSFESLGNKYFKDKNNVYVMYYGIDDTILESIGANSSEFKINKNGFGYDDKFVYSYEKKWKIKQGTNPEDFGNIVGECGFKIYKFDDGLYYPRQSGPGFPEYHLITESLDELKFVKSDYRYDNGTFIKNEGKKQIANDYFYNSEHMWYCYDGAILIEDNSTLPEDLLEKFKSYNQ